MGFGIGAAAVAVMILAGATTWWRRRRPRHELTMNDSYERAKGQAYLQGQTTRCNLGDPVPLSGRQFT